MNYQDLYNNEKRKVRELEAQLKAARGTVVISRKAVIDNSVMWHTGGGNIQFEMSGYGPSKNAAVIDFITRRISPILTAAGLKVEVVE